MKLIAKRDGGTYIVEKDGKYYLVNVFTQNVTLAKPSNGPGMFLKFGYFEDVDEISVADKNSIIEALEKNTDDMA